ncbi:MAG: PKD domain-containing protein [Patescibacteria group bacterium]
MKKIFIIVAMGVLVVPLISFVSARTADEIRAEIKEIETKLMTLRKELASVEGQGNVWCYSFEQNLRIGDKNNATMELKEVLRREGIYTRRDASADFDETLAASVTAFQEKYRDDILRPVGLSNGTGYVGKGTRAKLNALYGCTRPPVTGQNIDVKTPAVFTITPNTTARVVNYQNMTITLKHISLTKIVCITTPCISPIFAQIEVATPGGCGIDADPRCLGAPSFRQEYTMARGQTIDVMGLPITLSEISESKATFKIGKEDSTTNQPPVIKSVKGPTQLSVGEVGGWIIEAYDPERASLRYSVMWGDENNYASPSDISGREGGATNAQTTTFTHSYARAGAYTIRFVVSDNAGQEAKSSMTIQVGEKIANGSLYFRPDSMNLRVGQTQGVAAYFQPAMPSCPTGMACAQVMPASYRVDARFSVENSSIIGFQYAMPGCMAPESVYSYCGTYVIAEGKQVGSTKILASWNGFTATMPVSVSQ